MSVRPQWPWLTFLLVSYLCFVGCDLLQRSPPIQLSATQNAENQLASIRLRQIYLSEDLERLQLEKENTVKSLHDQGVQSATDREMSPQVVRLVKRLQLQVESLEKLRQQDELYQQAIVRLEANVRSLQLESAQVAQLDSKQSESLEVIIRQLDDQLNDSQVPKVIKDMELDELVNRELNSYRETHSDEAAEVPESKPATQDPPTTTDPGNSGTPAAAEQDRTNDSAN